MKNHNDFIVIRRNSQIGINNPTKSVITKSVRKPQKSSWEWYDPPEDSVPVVFCVNTSLHGLRYLGQKKRHICER